MEKQLSVTASPHIKSNITTKKIMLDVVIALLPASLAGCIFFGWGAFFTLVLAVASACATEIVYNLALKMPFKKIVRNFDFTSVITGLLLGLCMPAFKLDATFPWYAPILGSIFAIAVVKMIFGGTGKNIVNPAITGRIFLVLSFSMIMTSSWLTPNFSNAFGGVSAIGGLDGTLSSGATHLTHMLQTGSVANISNLNLFLGIGVAGCIGETCKLALVMGYVYLAIKKVIDWKLPLIYILSTGVMAIILNKSFDVFLPYVLSGGLFIGAIFMATDYVTTPNTLLGNIIYFALLGILTTALREATKMEVVSFAILLMNLLVPLFNTFIRHKPFGFLKSKKLRKCRNKKEENSL